MEILYAVIAVISAFILLNIIVIFIKLLQKSKPEIVEDYEKKTNTDPESLTYVYSHFSGIGQVPEGVEITDEYINTSVYSNCNYMNERYDCSDFRFQLIFRLYKDYGDLLPRESKDMIRKTVLDFKYFMDEPGDDSMCYWSENHQILFATAEYLAGQEFPDEVFTNSKMTGREHMAKALERIKAWQKLRFNFGFSEFLSTVYLMEDIAPMANYIEYSADEKTVQGMKIIMDILWFDVALHTVNNRFCAVSSRMYAGNKAGNIFGNSIGACMNALWGDESVKQAEQDAGITDEEKKQMHEFLTLKPGKMSINFLAMYKRGFYKLPKVIKKVALFNGDETIKMSSGISISDMVEENLIGQQPHQIMAQLGSETFTNPEVINNTIRYFKSNKMSRNKSISYFKFFDIPLFKLINPQKIAAKYELMPHGISIGQGNIYTYRTGDYTLSTVMNYRTDCCGAQEQIWNANIAGHLTLFTTHPARDDSVYGSSPGYWIGNGRRPMSVQNKNVNITVYKMPKKKRGLEFRIAQMSHMYMPKAFYDRFEQTENYVFAQKNNVLVCVIAGTELKFREFNKDSAKPFAKERNELAQNSGYYLSGEFDLCQYGGEYHAYITELSSLRKESFEQFKQRILNNDVSFNGAVVSYSSNGTQLTVEYAKEFRVNGTKENMSFDRYDCSFCKAKRKDGEIVIEGFGNRLTLNLTGDIRTENQEEEISR